MTCISPPPLDETTLLMYLDGEASRQIVEHIEKCPHCHQRAERLAHMTNNLKTRLFRATCPTSVELGEYHLGMLSQDQTASVAEHLGICPHCRQELEQLESYMADLEPTLEPSRLTQVKERVKVLIANLIDRGGAAGPGLTPLPAGIRGDDEEGPRTYQADDIEIMLDVQADTDQPDRRVILGLITGLDTPDDMEVHVWRADQLLTTAGVDDLGNFSVPNLAPATYELIVSGPDIEVHIQDLGVDTNPT